MPINTEIQNQAPARRSYVKPEIKSMDEVIDIVQANTGGGATDSGTSPNAYS